MAGEPAGVVVAADRERHGARGAPPQQRLDAFFGFVVAVGAEGGDGHEREEVDDEDDPVGEHAEAAEPPAQRRCAPAVEPLADDQEARRERDER